MKNIHFIGIGGIGISALAKYYHSKGAEVTGSDLSNSEIIESLKKKGLKFIQENIILGLLILILKKLFIAQQFQKIIPK